MKKRAITAVLAAVCMAVTAACGADAEIPAAGDKVVAQDAQESSTESFMGSGDLPAESPDAATDPAGTDADNDTLIADATKEAADADAGKETEQKTEDAAASAEADRVAGEQADAQAKAEAARKAEEEAAKRAQEEAAAKAEAEAKAQEAAAKAEAEAKAQEAAAAKAEAEAKAKAEAEAAAQAEAEAKAQQEAAAKAEAERVAREQAEAQRRAEEEARRQQEEAAKNAQGGSSNGSADVVENQPVVEPEPTPEPTPAPTPAPTPVPHEHSWTPVYETRTVVVKEAWTEPAWEEVVQWETVDICEVKYTCAGCGWSAQSNEANGDYSAYEAAGRHQMEGASSTTGTNPCGTITSEDVVVGQETVPLVVTQHPEKYHPAETTTEQVIIGYTCSCGATK